MDFLSISMKQSVKLSSELDKIISPKMMEKPLVMIMLAPQQTKEPLEPGIWDYKVSQ